MSEMNKAREFLKNKTIFAFDTETTGTDPEKHEILDLSLVIIHNLEVKFAKKLRFKPEGEIDPRALAVNGLKMEDIKKYPSKQESFEKLMKIIHTFKLNNQNRAYVLGYNVKFDIDMLVKLFKQFNDKLGNYVFLQKRLDPLYYMPLLEFEQGVTLPDYKLETVAKTMDIEINAHDSMSDVVATWEIFKKFVL